MSRRWYRPLAAVLLGVAGVLYAAIAVWTQSTASQGVVSPASKHGISPAFDPTYKAPRTPYGHPDLQGVFNHFTITPASRPTNYANREFFTEKEAADIFARAAQTPCKQAQSQVRYVNQVIVTTMDAAIAEARREQGVDAKTFGGPWTPCNPGLDQGDAGSNIARGYQGDFYDFGNWGPPLTKTLRTSLVVDPPDGRMPSPTPLAQKLMLEAQARDILKGGPEDLPPAMRCIVGDPGAPTILRGFPYNNNLQVFQSREYVAIRHDMNTYPRIVPLVDRPALPDHMKLWYGDSRGRWEGDTLVIETDHFRPDVERNGTIPRRFVERLTRIDADYLLYEVTVDNPEMYTKPYTLQNYLRRESHYVFEYSCHETNYNLAGELSEKRRLEKLSGK